MRSQRHAVHELGDRVEAGQIDDETFDIVLPWEVEAIRRTSQPPAVSGAIGQLSVCVNAASYQRWREVLPPP